MDKLQNSKVQSAMLVILSDGGLHTLHELHSCLSDDLAAVTAVHYHLSIIRRELRRRGENIVCHVGVDKVRRYQRVRVLASPYTGTN